MKAALHSLHQKEIGGAFTLGLLKPSLPSSRQFSMGKNEHFLDLWSSHTLVALEMYPSNVPSFGLQ